jgi:hypothetical protein
MLSIVFPDPAFRIRQQENFDEIFDPVRKRWIMLTPEEWVRQNFIAFLAEKCSIPVSLVAVEKMIKVGELNRRFDIVVYSKTGRPWLLVECKAINVVLNHQTISQMFSYVSALQCPYFFITNGTQTFGWQVSEGRIMELEQFPDYHKKSP